MEQSKKCKISDLTNDQLKVEELGVILGGMGDPNDQDADGCSTRVCIENLEGYKHLCTDAVCTSGIGGCSNNT